MEEHEPTKGYQLAYLPVQLKEKSVINVMLRICLTQSGPPFFLGGGGVAGRENAGPWVHTQNPSVTDRVAGAFYIIHWRSFNDILLEKWEVYSKQYTGSTNLTI